MFSNESSRNVAKALGSRFTVVLDNNLQVIDTDENVGYSVSVDGGTVTLVREITLVKDNSILESYKIKKISFEPLSKTITINKNSLTEEDFDLNLFFDIDNGDKDWSEAELLEYLFKQSFPEYKVVFI